MFVNADDQNIIENEENDEVIITPDATTDSPHEPAANNSHSNCQQQPHKRQFFHAKNYLLSIIQDDPRLEYERETLKTVARVNDLLSMTYDLFKISFIHDYNFAKLIDHILNLKKCLQKIHLTKTMSDAAPRDRYKLGNFI